VSEDRLFKVEAAGNDFLLGINGWAARLAEDSTLVARLCHRHTGVGADGALAVFVESAQRLRLAYRNGDGSEAVFCANGTRCAARAGVELLGMGTELVVVTAWDEVAARVDGAVVRLDLPAPPSEPRSLCLASGGRQWPAALVSLGVPHLVVPLEGLAALEVAEVAPALRQHPDLGPGGANVNFVELLSRSQMAVRTWERGVENETQCCGSGVVASALVMMSARGLRQVEVRARSGDRLTVEALGEPPMSGTRLIGEASFVAEVHPFDELLRS
jgi:diaminopimelate epimerase